MTSNPYRFNGHRLFLLLFFLYLSTANVYWIPYVHHSAWLFFKYSLFFLPSLYLVFRFFLENGAVNRYFLAWVFTLTGAPLLSVIFLQDDIRPHILDMLPVWVCMAAFSVALRGGDEDLKRIVRFSVFSVLSIILFQLVLVVFGVDEPNPYNLEREWITFQGSSFSATRTQWSNGLAVFFPFALFYFRCYWAGRSFNKWKAWFVALLFLISQMIPAGRAGVLSTLMVIFLFSLLTMSTVNLIFCFSLACFALFLSLEFILEKLRLDEALSSSGGWYELLNMISSGRLEQYAKVLEEGIFIRPISGWGFSSDQIGLSGEVGHFMLLRLWGQGGVLTFVVALLGFFVLSYIAMECLYDMYRRGVFRGGQFVNFKDVLYSASACSVLSGILISFFSHTVPIGTFQVAPIWWFSAYVVFGYKRNRERPST